MNILLMTNTYKPIVGGIEKSIEDLSLECRSKGHNTLVVAPVFKNQPNEEEGVFRIPAIQNFNGTDFSVEVPVPGVLDSVLKDFKPDIVHSHHPFLIGDTALRVSAERKIPIVFTHHTRYEKHTHYVPIRLGRMEKFIVELSTGYANLCDHVFAPSESIARLIAARGVKTPVSVNPTGIYPKKFRQGDGARFRKARSIPQNAYVIGYAGRVAAEKNINFLVKITAAFLKKHKDAYFLLVGDGPLLGKVKKYFGRKGLLPRLKCPGTLRNADLRDAYHAMDVFLFVSKTETQGLSLTEAMASGVPAVALEAPGTREVVKNGWNGCLLSRESIQSFEAALDWIRDLEIRKRDILKEGALRTAQKFSAEKSADRALEIYGKLIRKGYTRRNHERNPWKDATRLLKTEWQIVSNMAKAAGRAAKVLPAE